MTLWNLRNVADYGLLESIHALPEYDDLTCNSYHFIMVAVWWSSRQVGKTEKSERQVQVITTAKGSPKRYRTLNALHNDYQIVASFCISRDSERSLPGNFPDLEVTWRFRCIDDPIEVKP